ncbi:MAG TPA: family 20 glycosylhydrolase [Tepidisphaeraceae bacterium]|nr:family 20 glycosylhydrolase [Tepidisphaeraceae bacterium]
MFDSARCLESRSYYKSAIDFVSDRGANAILWHFTDDQGCTLEFDSVPGIASPNAYNKDEIRQLIKYARSRGIELIPEVASLGHSRYITRLPAYAHLNESNSIFTGICPISKETRQIIKKLIEEAAEVFDGPNFHVGLDEANFGDHPLTAAALQTRTRADIFTDHVSFIYGIVTRAGKRMWMWADGVLKDPEVARRVPRDVVMCNWQYRPAAPTDSTQYLLDQGFDVVLCPALISHDQTLFPGEEFALPNIRCMKNHEALTGQGKILGSICTIWTGVRFMSESIWPAIDLAAAIMDDPKVETKNALDRFAQEYFGLTGSDARSWADLCDRVMHLSPLRTEWLAIGKAQLPDEMTAEQIEAKGSDWERQAEKLRNLSSTVRRNRRAYRTFRLMVEVAAHWYAMTARLAMSDGPTNAELKRIYQKGSNLLRRVEGAWDQERHADDPKKIAPPVEYFRDDHLILLLRQGIESARQRLPAEREAIQTKVRTRKTTEMKKTVVQK